MSTWYPGLASPPLLCIWGADNMLSYFTGPQVDRDISPQDRSYPESDPHLRSSI